MILWSAGMNSLAVDLQGARAQSVSVSEDSLCVDLIDGRTILTPLVWYPRLWYGTPDERNNFEIIDDGALVSWPDLDEDLSIAGILAGRRSGESPQSLKRWLAGRATHARDRRGKRVERKDAASERQLSPSLSPAGVV
jgi:hypothetical protein